MSNIKWTYEEAKNMYKDLRYNTLDKIAQEYDASDHSNVRRILKRFGFPTTRARIAQFYLSEGDKAYIAGIIDGEGCISQDRITVGNTNLELIKWLHQKLGGSIRPHKRRVTKPQWKPLFLWTLSTVGSRGLLPLLLPYLIVKKAEAQNFEHIIKKLSDIEVFSKTYQEAYEVLTKGGIK